MKRQPMTGVEPAMLQWARQSMGLSVQDVARAVKKQVRVIEDWESGDGAPTYAEMEKLAYTVFKRPLALFFLPAPPDELPPRREFRTLPDTDIQSLAADTHLHIRRAHAYQLALKELFDRSPSERAIWRAISLNVHAPVQSQARAVRDYLEFTLDQQTACKSDDDALKQWREAVETTGVLQSC